MEREENDLEKLLNDNHKIIDTGRRDSPVPLSFAITDDGYFVSICRTDDIVDDCPDCGEKADIIYEIPNTRNVEIGCFNPSCKSSTTFKSNSIIKAIVEWNAYC